MSSSNNSYSISTRSNLNPPSYNEVFRYNQANSSSETVFHNSAEVISESIVTQPVPVTTIGEEPKVIPIGKIIHVGVLMAGIISIFTAAGFSVSVGLNIERGSKLVDNYEENTEEIKQLVKSSFNYIIGTSIFIIVSLVLYFYNAATNIMFMCQKSPRNQHSS